jgi:mono/diheme cytochrome c family protein
LYIACMDKDRVHELEAAQIHQERAVVRSWKAPRGPTSLAVDHEGERLFVWSHLARSLTVIGIAEKAPATAIGSLDIPTKSPLPAEIARGRDLFYSGERRISGDGRSCASCHPDGRDDGLVWATPDGPRQTPMLAGRLDGTAPYGWTGAAPDIESHVPKTFKRLGGKGLTGDDKAALLAYVRSLPSPPSLAPRDPNLVTRGQSIFASSEAGCAGCHGAGGDLPDGDRHDVKSRANGDVTPKFDTPSLKNVGGTGPWFHDGRYKNLRDLLVKSDGKMGHTKHLSPEDLEALEAYLQTL